MIGLNVIHFQTDQVEALGIQHVEVCLKFMQKNQKLAVKETVALVDTYLAADQEVSVHLPVCMPKGYPYGPFEVFFLDDDPQKKASSYALLDANLDLFKGKKIAFFVLHFSGIYQEEEAACFKVKCHEALSRISQLAVSYKTTILLEYFGLNCNLAKPSDWQIVNDYPNLGILVDTGHLYFASRMHGFDFYEAFFEMSHFASAYHLWNTGEEAGVYQASLSYQEKHHMPPLLTEVAGLAIDFNRIASGLLKTQKPLIIEASLNDGGLEKIVQAVKEWVTYEQKTP